MSFNRIVDRHIDAQNVRTAQREIPSGEISVREGWIFWLTASALFFVCAGFLGLHCLLLAPLVLLVLCGYSFAKRYTSSVHFVLGLALALAPGGVWYALTAEWSLLPLPLMAAVLCWVAGFDILYSCQDEQFDSEENLFSVPVRFGRDGAFMISRLLHVVTVALLVWNGALFELGWFYFFSIAIFAAFLVRQHLLVSPADLSRIDAAFFTQNGLASMSFFVGVLGDYLLG